MSKEQEIKDKIMDLTLESDEINETMAILVKHNNNYNKRIQDQIDSLEEDMMILEKPKMLESDLEIMVKDLADIVSTILDSTTDNINDLNPKFEIGSNNEVSISSVNLDYDATEDIQRYLEERFNIIVPDQTQNIN